MTRVQRDSALKRTDICSSRCADGPGGQCAEWNAPGAAGQMPCDPVNVRYAGQPDSQGQSRAEVSRAREGDGASVYQGQSSGWEDGSVLHVVVEVVPNGAIALNTTDLDP